jgi:hypothetical protein
MSALRNSILVLILFLSSSVSAEKLVGVDQPAASVLVANCGIGSSILVANITHVGMGSSGTVMFSCGANGSAITVTNGGTVTPQFSLPPGYTSLKISTSPACASGISLSPGSSLSFGTGAGAFPVASYNYCASFSNAPASGLATFTVTWTQSAQSISSVECGHDASCSVQSNATLSNIRFAGNTIHVEADGPHDAGGFANVTVPKSAVPHIDTLHVFVDNSKLGSSAVTITSNSTDYFLYFTFTFHSPVLIDIQLTAPENAATPSILGLDPTLFYEIVAALIAVVIMVSAVLVVRRRRRTRPAI